AVTVEYKFGHDRIQQAAYALIPDAERPAVHWRVGQSLLQHPSLPQRETKLFDIVNNLNHGRTLIRQRATQDELAAFNLAAGKKAKGAVAYQPAWNYLRVGLGLLTSPPASLAQTGNSSAAEDCWARQYRLSLSLYEEAAEAAYLSGEFEEAQRL